jgi:hypothetical protein
MTTENLSIHTHTCSLGTLTGRKNYMVEFLWPVCQSKSLLSAVFLTSLSINSPHYQSRKVKSKWKTKKKKEKRFRNRSQRKENKPSLGFNINRKLIQNRTEIIQYWLKTKSLTHEGRTNLVSAGKHEFYSLSLTMIRLHLKTGKTNMTIFTCLSSQYLVMLFLLFCW